MKKPNHYYRMTVRAPRASRILVGLALVIAGMFGFLPILGFWMIPLGLVIMFFEVPLVRERWRWARAWWKAWRAGNGTGGTPSV